MSGDDETKTGIEDSIAGAGGLGWALTSTATAAGAASAGLVGAAFAGGYELGTGLDHLTHGALSGGVESGMEYVFGDPSQPSQAQLDAQDAEIAQHQMNKSLDHLDQQEEESELYGSQSVAHDDPPPPPPEG
jgi:hypothetical protein